tara:strand:+ start:8718 stop:9131 length:414 start_codon:yes stop_codon:yes gene_type:complete
MSTTTIIILVILIALFLIWLGFKVWEWDSGDNFSITTFLIFIGILCSIVGIIFLKIIRKENGAEFWDIGSIILTSIPILLFSWNTKRVFSTNKFFTSLLILFYHLLLIALSPIIIILIFWAIGKGKELFSFSKNKTK